jgi:hypothetical protein
MSGSVIHLDEREQYVWIQVWKFTKNVRKLEIKTTLRNFGMKNLFLLSYFFYFLFLNN